jgi:putative ABC transport system permease protein
MRTAIVQAFRRLTREARYSTAVVLVLAAGIGPAAAISSVVHDVLVRPFDYSEPERLGLVRISLGRLSRHPGLTSAEVADLRATNAFAQVEAQTLVGEASYGEFPDYTALSQVSVTTGMLPMLGVQPVLGRMFVDADVPPPMAPPPPRDPGAPAPPPPPLPPQKILLDHTAWQTHFNGDTAVLGRFIELNGRDSEIIGVLPRGFRLVTGRASPQRIDVYTPMAVSSDFRGAWNMPTLVRLRPGTSFVQAQARLDAFAAAMMRDHADTYQGPLEYAVAPLLDDMTSATRPALRAAVAAVFLLSIIAFANATALVVARLKTRETDFAVRAALGARPATLALQVIFESLILTGVGAAVGCLLAVATAAGVREIIPRTVPRWDEIGIGWRQIYHTSGLALAGLLLLGLIPAWKMSRGTSFGALRSGSAHGGMTTGVTSRFVLVATQIVFTVVLAFGSTQLARSAAGLRAVDLGYDADVITFRVPFDFRRYDTRTARAELYQRIRDRVGDVAGVASVGVVTHLPLSGAVMMSSYQADLTRELDASHYANYQGVTPGYFATMRIALVQGRDFTDVEDATQQPVIIVDETLARSAFPGESNVIGRTLRLGWGLENAQIVGVVRHARTIEVGREVRPQIYAPIGNLFAGAGIVTVRATDDGRASSIALNGEIAAAIAEIGPGRAIGDPVLLTDNVTAAMSTLVAVTGLVTFLAVGAGLLSAIGLYLVIAYVVHQRRRATAIRSAVGASPTQIMWDNFRTTGFVAAFAVTIGTALSLAAAPLLRDLLYGVATRDLLSLTIAVIIAFVAAALGTLVPVRRAARADILSVLRES